MKNKNLIIALTISFVASIELNAQTPGKQTPTNKPTVKLVKPVESNSKKPTDTTSKKEEVTQTKQTNTNNTNTTTTNSGLKLNTKELQNGLQKDTLMRDKFQKELQSVLPTGGKRIEIKSN